MNGVSDISLVIPAYNEAHRIKEPIKELQNFCIQNLENYEVIFVDDGSRDETENIITQSISGWTQAKLLKLEMNSGKGAAIQRGVLQAAKKNLCFMDADLSTDLTMIQKLFEKLSDQQPVVIGSRDIKGAEITVHQNFFREYSAKLFNLWIQFWLLPGVWDTQCGFKLFRTDLAKEVFQNLQHQRFGFDLEILYRIKKKGFSILEVPVRWKNVLGSRVSPLKDGISMAIQTVKIRFFTK